MDAEYLDEKPKPYISVMEMIETGLEGFFVFVCVDIISTFTTIVDIVRLFVCFRKVCLNIFKYLSLINSVTNILTLTFLIMFIQLYKRLYGDDIN